MHEMKKHLIKILTFMPYNVKKAALNLHYRFTEAGKISNFGERFVVSSWKEMIECGEFYHLYHAYRYYWAHELISFGIPILDLGCGSGYGSWYLNRGYRHVTGFDSDVNSINWARKHFQTSNIEFTAIKNWLDWCRFPCIVCFEVIEHNPKDVMETILNSLEDRSVLLISTANSSKQSVRQWLINRKLAVINPSHKKEFTPKEFKTLLESCFSQVEIFGQCVKEVYNFKDYNKWRRKNNVKLTDFEMRSNDFVNCEVVVARCRK